MKSTNRSENFEKMKTDVTLTLRTSCYLNIYRFSASFLVFIFHMGYFSGYRLGWIGNLGDEAVLAFFVLSGVVIAYSATTKHSGLVDFSIARFSRLWSVVIPAIFLTFILDTLGQRLSLAAYGNLHPYDLEKWIVSSVASVLFLNQIWHFHLWIGSNGPFWSVSYEFWYYVIFASIFYFAGWRKLVAVALCVAIAGPKILIAFPVWLIGVAVYLLIAKYGPSRGWISVSIWWGSILLVIIHAKFHLNLSWPLNSLRLKTWQNLCGTRIFGLTAT